MKEDEKGAKEVTVELINSMLQTAFEAARKNEDANTMVLAATAIAKLNRFI